MISRKRAPPPQFTPTPEPRREPIPTGVEWRPLLTCVAVAAVLGVVVYSCSAVAAPYDPVDQVYQWLWPKRAPAPVPPPQPKPQPEPEPTKPPVVVITPTPTPPVAEPDPPAKIKIVVRKKRAETFKRKQRRPTADECAKMRNAGRTLVIFMAPKEYTRAQVEQALKDCGL